LGGAASYRLAVSRYVSTSGPSATTLSSLVWRCSSPWPGLSHRFPTVSAFNDPSYPGGFSRFIRRGQLNFEDGLVVYHSVVFIRRAKYIVQEGNTPAVR
jgi:hypothetical protein